MLRICTSEECDMVAHAALFAEKAHVGQVRKYTGEPYINHPNAVAGIVSLAHEASPQMVAAAYLHDVIEDCGVTSLWLRNEFGSEVTTLVEWLTDVSQATDGNRAVRKAMDRNHIAKAPPQAKTIKLADMIDNSRSILLHDIKFAKVYIPEKRQLLEVLRDGDALLYKTAQEIVAHAEVALAQLAK